MCPTSTAPGLGCRTRTETGRTGSVIGAISRGSDNAELSRRVRGRAAGQAPRLLPGTDRPFHRVIAVGWTVCALHGRTWWQLMIAAFLTVMSAQVGFLGHDARASAGVPVRAPQQRAGPAAREPSPARRSYSPYSPYSQGDRSRSSRRHLAHSGIPAQNLYPLDDRYHPGGDRSDLSDPGRGRTRHRQQASFLLRPAPV